MDVDVDVDDTSTEVALALIVGRADESVVEDSIDPVEVGDEEEVVLVSVAVMLVASLPAALALRMGLV